MGSMLMDDAAYERFFDPNLFIEEGFSSQTVQFGDIQLLVSGVAMTKFKEHEHLRTGHILWASAQVLAQYLVSDPAIITGGNKRVLELGCGLGLTGLVAAKLAENPCNVVVTDGDEHVFDALELNIEQNFLDPSSRPKCAILEWGENIGDFKRDHGVFDVIIGADVLYHEPCVMPLLRTVRGLLRDAPSRYLMVFQKKYGGIYQAAMLQAAQEVGLEYKHVDWSTARAALEDKDPGYQESWDVEFLEFSLASQGSIA